MPVNTSTVNTFSNSFMRGFSFVDDINQRRRAQDKLDARLEEERTERDRQRTRQEAADARVAENFEFTKSERTRQANDRDRTRNARRVGLDDDSTLEQLEEAAIDSPTAASELGRRRKLTDILQATRDIRGAAPATPGGTPGTAAGGLTGAVQQLNDPNALPGETAQPTSLLGASEGRDTLQSVDLDELSQFDKAAPTGFGGQALENLQGFGGSIADIAQQVGPGGGVPRDSGTRGLSDAIGGNIQVPEAFTTEAEFENIQDPAEIEASRSRNQQIIDGLKARGVDAGASNRISQLRAGSRQQRRAAVEAENAVVERYEGVADPTQDNAFRELASSDPEAATLQYFTDRATLQSGNPILAAAMDQQMTPVIQAATTELQAKAQLLPIGGPEIAQVQRNLLNVQATANQVNRDYSPSTASGIDARGVPIGNAQFAGDVAGLLTDPNRPRPGTPLSGRAAMTASTQVNRIPARGRATDTQLKAAITLADAGLLGTADLNTLIMTGSLPNTSPAAKLQAYKPGDVVYSVSPNGSFRQAFTVPGGSGSRGGKGRGGDTGFSNQLDETFIAQTEAQLKALYPGDDSGSREARSGILANVLNNADVYQETLDLTDPIAGRRFVQSMAQAHLIAEAEDLPFFPNFLEEAPSPQEIMADPELAARLSKEHDIPFTNLQRVRNDQVNINNLRQEVLRPNAFPAALQEAAEQQDDNSFLHTVIRYDHLTAPQGQ